MWIYAELLSNGKAAEVFVRRAMVDMLTAMFSDYLHVESWCSAAVVR